MKIAVASGKGGTGKTTIATNLACSIDQSGKAVHYIDCDVEEPNGHIFLKPVIEQKQIAAIAVPQVDLTKCDGCAKCAEFCQYSAIICLKEKALVFNQICHSCGGCTLVCPQSAIKEVPKEIGSVETGRAGGVKFSQGRLKIGDIHTPPLIKQVKATASDDAVVIIDAPPGTSCPVIEAVKDCDFVLMVTEPTPFGLNDLKLAVGMVRKLQIPFAVAVNRAEPGEEMIDRYCRDENIDIIFTLADDRRIAEAYSVGKMAIDVLGEYKKGFVDLYENIQKKIDCQAK